jgi:DNA polymerase-3 subunit delta
VEAVTPQSTEAEIDHLLHAVAEGDVRTLGPLMSKFEAQGLTPTTLCIGASRHLRMLHRVASHKNGPDAGIAGLRPPVFGPRRDRLMRQARAWSLPALERAISMLLETDLALRSSSNAPLMAQIERSFIRIAMMRRQ